IFYKTLINEKYMKMNTIKSINIFKKIGSYKSKEYLMRSIFSIENYRLIIDCLSEMLTEKDASWLEEKLIDPDCASSSAILLSKFYPENYFQYFCTALRKASKNTLFPLYGYLERYIINSELTLHDINQIFQILEDINFEKKENLMNILINIRQ